MASAGGARVRATTRELRHVKLDPVLAGSRIAGFVTLPSVAAVLDHEAGIVVAVPEQEQRYSSAYACPSEYLLTTPTAQQCCYSQDSSVGFKQPHNVRRGEWPQRG